MPLYVCVWHYNKITSLQQYGRMLYMTRKERITPKLCNFYVKEAFISQKCQCYKVTQKTLGLKWRVGGVSPIWVECERTVPQIYFAVFDVNENQSIPTEVSINIISKGNQNSVSSLHAEAIMGFFCLFCFPFLAMVSQTNRAVLLSPFNKMRTVVKWWTTLSSVL